MGRRNRNAGPRWKTNSGKVEAICEDCKTLFSPKVKREDEGRVPRWCKRCRLNHKSEQGSRR